MLSQLAFGFAVRFVQSLAQAAPFILTGFFIAAVFRRFIGYEKLRQVFGGSEMSSLFKAWVIGMLLPVCSLGVIPVIVEMRRAGIKGGTILAFAMSAPLFNPLSMLYGLTLSEPLAILSFAACSLVIVTVVGMIWDRIFPGSELTGVPDESVHYGIRRMAALGVSAGREATGRSLKLVLCGLIGVGLLGAVIPHASLQHQFNHDQPLAPLKMAALGIPVYATPMLAMSQMGMMFQHANSIGAAFVLLALGAGMNMGLIAWMLQEYGMIRSAVWMSILLAVVIVWNDPVNLMSYVTYVFQKLFGYSLEKATELMLDVHEKGRAVVASCGREEAEMHVFRLHEHSLWATMEHDGPSS